LRAIVFDFDGVIANSEPLHFRAYRDVLKGDEVTLTEADYYARYLGYDDMGAFKAIAEDRSLLWSGEHVAALVERKARRMEELERDASVLFPGARTAIELAAGAMPIAIASGALGAEIRRVLEHANLSSHFTAIVAAEDTPASKPAPDPYLKAVALLGRAKGPIAAADCVAIEDSKWGLESARAAGLRTVAVAHTYSVEDLRASADMVIPSMEAFDLVALQRRFAG
jgi:HAD superfamily hydrolase (TIGR01509 family)